MGGPESQDLIAALPRRTLGGDTSAARPGPATAPRRERASLPPPSAAGDGAAPDTLRSSRTLDVATTATSPGNRPAQPATPTTASAGASATYRAGTGLVRRRGPCRSGVRTDRPPAAPPPHEPSRPTRRGSHAPRHDPVRHAALGPAQRPSTPVRARHPRVVLDGARALPGRHPPAARHRVRPQPAPRRR